MRVAAILAAIWMSTEAVAAPCGGTWSGFLDGVRKEALGQGIDARAVEAVLGAARQSQSVLKADRAQGSFKQSFVEFSSRAVSADRLKRAKVMQQKYGAVFKEAERRFGVPAEVILGFWAMETDYGAVMGNISTVSALATLAHDCRRPELFRPQLIGAMALVERGDMAPDVTGAWAGEIGHVQMLPGDILRLGIDGDGDGRVLMKQSAPDAILTAGALLAHHGWRRGEPWLVEVEAAQDMDWSLSGFGRERRVSDWAARGVVPRAGSVPQGLEAALVLPMGRKGPKFLVFRNFWGVYLEWNKSLIYATTAGYFATRLAGAPPVRKGNGTVTPISQAQMKQLQRALARRGFDVGKIDGVLGAGTRAAVKAMQKKYGLPADSYPTAALLRKLR